MLKNSSTKELTLSSNERLNLNKSSKPLFKFKKINNLKSKFFDIYTFHSGFKKKNDDLLIIIFKTYSNVSALYSKTSTPSAPIIWDKKNNKGLCKILIVNAGNANAHTGHKGVKNINKYTKVISKKFNCSLQHVLVSSTGVIGEQLDVNKIINCYSQIKLSKEKDLLTAAKAIMTTDTFPKIFEKNIKINSETIRIFGFAKGSGMIAPNMGTMLSYIFIEKYIEKKNLRTLLYNNIEDTFNSITIDGDTSTSDTLMLFSLGEKNSKKINKNELKRLSGALKEVMFNLSFQIVCDGEGISKLMKVNVKGSISYLQASKIAFSIANSPLVKTAVAGEDANWGRIIMAIGKSNTKIDQNKIKLKFGNILVASNGMMAKNINFLKLDKYMKNRIIEINVNINQGNFSKTVYASDLTHEYIRINGDYRS